MFQGCSKEVSRVIPKSFLGASKKFQGCFNAVLSGVQGCVKDDQIGV